MGPSLPDHLKWLGPLLGNTPQIVCLPLNFDNHSLPSPVDRGLITAPLAALCLVFPLHTHLYKESFIDKPP